MATGTRQRRQPDGFRARVTVGRQLHGPDVGKAGSPDEFAVSARTGAGFDRFERRLVEIVRERLDADEAPLVTRARHRELVEEALGAVERALEGARIGIGAELVS